MWHIWWKGEVHAGVMGKPEGDSLLEDLDINGRVIGLGYVQVPDFVNKLMDLHIP